MKIAKQFKNPGRPKDGVDWLIETPGTGWVDSVTKKSVVLSSSTNHAVVYADEAAAAKDGYKATTKAVVPTPATITPPATTTPLK